jgi:hypothetical protein
MNFKFNKQKTTIGLTLLAIATILASFLIANYACTSTTPLCDETGCPEGWNNPCSTWNPGILLISLLISGIPVFIISYIIYSLIEKKNPKKEVKIK